MPWEIAAFNISVFLHACSQTQTHGTQVVTSRAAALLEVEVCNVFVVDRDRAELWSKTSRDIDEIRFSADKGIAGQVRMVVL